MCCLQRGRKCRHGDTGGKKSKDEQDKERERNRCVQRALKEKQHREQQEQAQLNTFPDQPLQMLFSLPARMMGPARMMEPNFVYVSLWLFMVSEYLDIPLRVWVVCLN